MRKSKRQGNELSINIMIVLALGLLILIIGAVIVIKTAGKTNDTTDCLKQNGKCEKTCPDNMPITIPYSCADKEEKCCSNIGINTVD
jgi:hypothetical protein